MRSLHLEPGRNTLLFRLAFALATLALSTAAAAQPAPGAVNQPSTTQPADGSVVLTVTVTDSKGYHVLGLGKEAFNVYGDGRPQSVTYFSSRDEPASVGVVFDASGSIGGEDVKLAAKRLELLKNGLSHFMRVSNSSNEYFLVVLADRPQVLMDWTRDGSAIVEKLGSVQFKGDTALYDACYLALEKVKRGSHSKRAILLISDGQDNTSRYKYGELSRSLKETDVLFYSVWAGSELEAGSSLGEEGSEVLKRLASISGGQTLFPTTVKELNGTFEFLGLELRHQYSVGFKPADPAGDGKWHRVRVEVKPPGKSPRPHARSRDGYYVPKSLR